MRSSTPAKVTTVPHAVPIRAPLPAKALLIRDDTVQAWLDKVNRPEEIAAAAATARQQTAERYTGFVTQNLSSAEDSERLFRLLDDKRQCLLDVAVASFQNGVDPRNDLAGYQRGVAEARAAIDLQINELLGDDGYARLQNYDDIIERQNVFTRLGRALNGTPDAFSAEQTQQLTTLLQWAPHGHLTPPLVDSAARFLNPAQVNALRLAQDTQDNVQRQRAVALMPPVSP